MGYQIPEQCLQTGGSFSLKHPNALKLKRINRINGSTGAAKNVLPWSSKQVVVVVKELQMKMKKPLVYFFMFEFDVSSWPACMHTGQLETKGVGIS